MHFPPISTQSLCKTLQQAKGMRGFLVHAEKNPQFLPISPHFLPNLCPNSCCKAQRVPGFFWCMQQNPHFRPFSTLVLIQNLSQAKQPRGFLVHAAKKNPFPPIFYPILVQNSPTSHGDFCRMQQKVLFPPIFSPKPAVNTTRKMPNRWENTPLPFEPPRWVSSVDYLGENPYFGGISLFQRRRRRRKGVVCKEMSPCPTRLSNPRAAGCVPPHPASQP